jgi:hypothetical protein
MARLLGIAGALIATLLPPVEDGLHDIRREAGQWKELADIGVCDALLLRGR